MSAEPSDGYKATALKMLGDAIDRRDGDAAVAVIELARIDGYGTWADEVLGHLVRRGLERLASGTR